MWLADRRKKMPRGKARITDLVLNHKDGTKAETYTKAVGVGRVPTRKLHTKSQLKYGSYLFAGEIELQDIPEGSVVVTVDAYAYRARHQTTLRIIHLILGNIPDTITGKQFSLKLGGVIRGDELYIITDKANHNVKDIASHAPRRFSGMSHLYNVVREAQSRFSSNESNTKVA
jgi:hypothetical protein